MITRDELERNTRFDKEGRPVPPMLYFCARCFGQVHFCEDPCCWDVLHHTTHRCRYSHSEAVDARDLSAYYIFDPDTYEEALAEAEGYEEYTRLMYKHWGVK